LQDPIAGLNVFLVEDEPLILMVLKDMIDSLGAKAAADARLLPQALELASSADFDLAILDVNLSGAEVYPVADAILARGIPLVFASGFGAGGIPAAYRKWPVVEKPYQLEDLEAGIRKGLAAA
tara:strand:- start:619 stop:987 length:369 start_codon:yes stop_codon:yes gene_type:complete